ncbi:hypothetical protein P3T76_009877 [Phytophthora citrophthora]|uniref:RxLR effector protein n=1 Tax=Phytophthora citrophthora TaxID=4793 RepID=A0AAD9GEQ0_9STRA|nr:hypothetical protein P3T76_009877 [Phytophthora citrophthora]
MRLTFLLVVIATAFFSSSDATASSSPANLAISNSADPLRDGGVAGERVLRGPDNRYFDEEEEEEEEEEERALPNLSKLDDSNLTFLVNLFKGFDDTGVPGLIAFLRKEALNMDEMLALLKSYQQFRAVGPKEFMKTMTKAIGS